MKVLHLNTWDYEGGAAKGMYTLHRELIKQGIDSNVLVLHKITNDSSVHQVESLNDNDFIFDLDLLPRRLYKNRRKEEVISNAIVDRSELLEKINIINPDIVHLHWVYNGFISTEDIKKIKQPIIWTLRDMAPFSGGCHYSRECNSYITGCGQCHLLKSEDDYDITYQNVQRKLNNFDKNNMTIIGISNWISEEAKKSLVFQNFNVSTINNAIDTKLFYPEDKEEAKKRLLIKTNKPILSFGAHQLNDSRKGLKYFLKALNQLKYDVFIIFFGIEELLDLNDIKQEYISIGFLDNTSKLRDIYSVSNIFVAPVLEEAFGKTIVEAMSCGTPVVCFENAGGPDSIVEHKVNGYKATKYSYTDLAKGIKFILNTSDNYFSINAYTQVYNNFSVDIIAKKYISLYKQKHVNSKRNIVKNKISSPFDGLMKIKELNTFVEYIFSLEDQKIIVYGYGIWGKFLQAQLKNKIIAFMDKDIKKIDDKFIFHPSKHTRLKFDKIVISIFDYTDIILDDLINNYNIKDDKIITFDNVTLGSNYID